jgi:hypothetical protein
VFRNIEEIKRANKEAGHHFFDPDTMRFFGSRVSGELVAGRYFITSEHDFYGTKRLYTLRVANGDGTVDTVGEFQKYATLAEAKRALKALGQDVRQEAGK